jgi:putative sterol carrier protein
LTRRDLGSGACAVYVGVFTVQGETLMADLASVTEHIRGAVGDNSGLGKTVKIDLGDTGKIFIDGASIPNTVTNEDKPADATVSISWDDFMALSEGRLDPMMAFMQGKLKIAGDMMIAQKLAPLLKR